MFPRAAGFDDLLHMSQVDVSVSQKLRVALLQRERNRNKSLVYETSTTDEILVTGDI